MKYACAGCGAEDCTESPLSDMLVCGYCEASARTAIRNKVSLFLSDPGNFTKAEWYILYHLKDKILEF